MKGLYLAILAPLALTGCAALPGLPGQAPAPLAATTADDKALETAWKAFDVALDAVNLLGDAGVIVPGSERGRAVAAAIRRVNRSLAAAERFDAVLSSGDYNTALNDAAAGMADLRTAIKGGQ